VSRTRTGLVAFLAVLAAACAASSLAQEEPAKQNASEAPAPLLPFLKSGWNELDTSWISVRLTFAALEDGAFYSQDPTSKRQVGSLTPEGLFRVDDLLLSGQIKFARPWTYVVGGNYKGLDPTSAQSWTTTYLYVSIPLGALGSVAVGKQKEGLGMEMVENGRDLPFMERSTLSTAFAFVDSHIVGVRFSNTVAAGRMTWSAGWFNNWLDDGLTFDQSGNIFGGRVTGLALEADGGANLIHLGVSGVYRQSKNGSFELKSVPEVYEAPDFVDTGSFPASHGASVGGELAVVHGPLTISGEYAATGIASPAQTAELRFSGYYAMATWSLTGETRPYDHTLGAFGAISPSAPFSFKNGGPGAWEVAARYSSVDLTSGAVQGGKFDRVSGALSWYPTSQVRFEFDYGYGRLERSGLVGHTNFYQLRLQFQL
jgi:phosphate-selective porin OprO/OprP